MFGDCYFGLPTEPVWFDEPEPEAPENVGAEREPAVKLVMDEGPSEPQF